MFFLVVFLDPNNSIFGLKYILFAALFGAMVVFKNGKQMTFPTEEMLPLVFFCIVLPLYGLLMWYVNKHIYGNITGDLIYLNSFVFFSLLLVIYILKIPLLQYFTKYGFVVAVITISIWIVYKVSIPNFWKVYDYLVIKNSAITCSGRTFLGIPLLMVFYKTSPLLVFGLSHYANEVFFKRHRLHQMMYSIAIFVVFVWAMFLSGTRANIISAFGIIAFYTLWFFSTKRKIVFYFVLTTLFVLAIPLLYDLSKSLFDGKEQSNAIKFGHFLSYLDLWSDNPLYLFTGQGFGAKFYSGAYMELMDRSELTYFELVRIFGLPFALIILFFLLYPLIFKLKMKDDYQLIIAYLFYLVIIGTNPLLMSSTGMIVLVYVYSYMMLKPKKSIVYA